MEAGGYLRDNVGDVMKSPVAFNEDGVENIETDTMLGRNCGFIEETNTYKCSQSKEFCIAIKQAGLCPRIPERLIFIFLSRHEGLRDS